MDTTMTLKNSELEGLLQVSIRLCLEAGKEILRIYNGEFSIDKKKDDSPLTLADLESNRILFRGLSDTGIPVLSEEEREIPYEVRKDWQYLWLIDPLDGTKEFIKRNGEFTVNISLIEGQTPVLGVIYAPARELLYFALKAQGAFKQENPSSFNDINDIMKTAEGLPLERKKRPFTVVASCSHMSEKTEEFIENLKKEFDQVEVLSAGSSLKFCLIAEGLADLYPRFGPTMEWDTAAGHAIVEEAGGRVITLEGKPLLYNKPSLENPDFIVVQGLHLKNGFIT